MFSSSEELKLFYFKTQYYNTKKLKRLFEILYPPTHFFKLKQKVFLFFLFCVYVVCYLLYIIYSTSLKGVDFEERRCRFLHLWTQHYLVIFPSCENSIHFENLRNLMAIINSDNPTTQIFSSRIFK